MTLAFNVSEEQQILREVIRKFLEDKSGEAAVRAQMDSAAGYDVDMWREMAGQMELQGVSIPTEYGGQGFSFVELCIVLEEMGRVLLCAPYFSSIVLAANALLLSGDGRAKAALLPQLASGAAIGTLAVSEGQGGWDDAGIAMQAMRSGDRWTLNGTKMFVLDGHIADIIIVAARTEDGVSLFSVAGDADGLARTAMTTMDQTRKLAKLDMANVSADLIGESGAGLDILEKILELASIALAAEQVGGAQKCLEMAVDYAKLRVQFGRTIGSFQAIKHKCADMLLEVESAKSAAYYGAWCAAEMNDDLSKIAAVAKSYCSEVFFRTAAENIQIHGGIGFTWEHPAHLYFKRAKSSELLFGSPARHRELLAQRLGV